ncbi:hypothetical protein PFICI_08450 [Pestalotiopsis fici W106-1]|uniref:Uncharacterized protein n=1 Tax=Pestalotiopsis fici (strain W106-1 / CGMCC3.15140) TaxID=1229662 RepID=W3X6W2_PESFW|nr:uncharacterized protein PFICI_08450 [Pestalotiopsis fici W106-1]ETS80921.1 hypothetical protein PFICI_08450 [Pestalotiopsis fici W106-1]
MLTGTTVNILPRNAVSFNPTERQVSVGAVWSVGGTAPGAVAIDGGRGRFLGSGTTAPLYTMPFTKMRPKSEEHQEKHEGRLAQALQIDPVQRILGSDIFSTFPRCRSNRKAQASLDTSRTNWTGTEWLNDGQKSGMSR